MLAKARHMAHFAPRKFQVQALGTSAVRRCGAGPIYDDIEDKLIAFGQEGSSSQAQKNVEKKKQYLRPRVIPRATPIPFSIGAPGVLKRGFSSGRETTVLQVADANAELDAEVSNAIADMEKDVTREWIRSTYASGFRDAAGRSSADQFAAANLKSANPYSSMMVRSEEDRVLPTCEEERAFVDACFDYFDFRKQGAIDYFAVEAAYKRAGMKSGLESAGESVARLLVECDLASGGKGPDGRLSTFTRSELKGMDLIRAVKTGVIRLDERNFITIPELSRWALRIVDNYANGSLEGSSEMVRTSSTVEIATGVPRVNLLERIKQQAQSAGALHAAQMEYHVSKGMERARRHNDSSFVRRMSDKIITHQTAAAN